MITRAVAIFCISASLVGSIVSSEGDRDSPEMAMSTMYDQYCTGKDAEIIETAATTADAMVRPMNQCMCGFLRETHEIMNASSVRGAAVSCSDGFAGDYECMNVDLQSYMNLEDVNGGIVPEGILSDCWGWTSSSGKEFAIVATFSGTTFVDITDPVNPKFEGKLASKTGNSMWRDIKTYKDHAFIVSEASGHGMQVYDMTQLLVPPRFSVDIAGHLGRVMSETAHYNEFSNAHNIVINEETGFAYAVGTNTCGGGLHMIDINDPVNPKFVGCFSEDGYTHDAQCVIYKGADGKHQGKEICFACNAHHVSIVDVTDKANPVLLSRTSYNGSDKTYTHQGWLTENHNYFIIGDETDEIIDGIPTRTLVLNVMDLALADLAGEYFANTMAVDHNMYVKGNLIYQANYMAGLRIIRMDDISKVDMTEVGYFDITPNADAVTVNGAWSVYPYFPSGNVIISGIEQGLFVVKPTFASTIG